MIPFPLLLRMQIVLVDQLDRFVFKPLLYELLTQGSVELMLVEVAMAEKNKAMIKCLTGCG